MRFKFFNLYADAKTYCDRHGFPVAAISETVNGWRVQLF